MKIVTKEGSFYQWYRLLSKYHTQKLKQKANRQQLLLLKEFLGAKSVFFDVGANKGLFSYWASKYIGNEGCIHMFEPQSELFWIFKKFETKFPKHKFFINNFGLSDRKSFAKLERNCIGDGSATLNTVNENYPTEDVVKLETLDHYCESHQINRLDFIKIDVEGHEFKTIRGGIETIKRFRPALLIEMTPEIQSTNIINEFIDIGYQVKMIIAGQIFELKSTSFQNFMRADQADGYHADFLFYI